MRWLAMALGLPVATAALLAVEVQLATRGPRLALEDFVHHGAGALTAVWIGDSTAAGVGAPSGSESVASEVARARDERVVMLAVSGATAAEVVTHQLPNVGAEEPAVVYVSVGANDVTHLTSRGDFRRSYERLVRRLTAIPGVRVVALGVPDMGAPPRLLQPLRSLAGLRGRQLDRVIRSVVREHPRVTYVDIAGSTGPAFRREPSRFFSADLYHPSPEGYELWARAVLAAIAR